jgi:hypothetical protein
MRHDTFQKVNVTLYLRLKCRAKEWQLRAIFAAVLSDYVATN